MDNLTHALTGLLLSRAGLDRGGKHTGVMLILAANAPDIDTYPFFYDSLRYLEVHRGPAHSLAFAPLVALLPLALVRGITRTRPTLWEWIACMIAVLSHLALDWTNVYGVRMLLPFSGRWLRLDMTNVIDPFIWLILLLALAAPALAGLVTSEIAGRKTRTPRRTWAWISLLLLLAYEGARYTYHERAVATLDARLYMGVSASRVYAFPDRLGFNRWRGIVEATAGGDNFVFEIPVDLASPRLNMNDAYLDYPAHDARAIDAARTTRTFQVAERFNQVPFWRISPMSDVTQVQLLDLRFSSLRSRGGGFTATALVGPNGGIRNAGFGFGLPASSSTR